MLLRSLPRLTKYRPLTTAAAVSTTPVKQSFGNFETIIKTTTPHTQLNLSPPPTTTTQPSYLEPNHPVLIKNHRYLSLSPLNFPPTARPWIVQVSDVSDTEWCLHTPFHPVPNYFRIMGHPVTGQLDFSECRVQELHRRVSLYGFYSDGSLSDVVSKKVVGGSGAGAPLLAILDDMCGTKQVCKSLFYLNNCHCHTNWAKIDINGQVFDEIAYYKGKFYAFDKTNWCFRVIDANGVPGEPIHGPNAGIPSDSKLVDVDMVADPDIGSLHLIVTVCDRQMRKLLVAYRYDEEECEWEFVRSIGDRVLLIGDGVAFGINSPIECVPKGSIYTFKNQYSCAFRNYSNKPGRRALPEGAEALESLTIPVLSISMQVFNPHKADRGIVPLERLSEEEMHAFTGLFFPPPSWIKWRCPTLDNLEVKLHNLSLYDNA